MHRTRQWISVLMTGGMLAVGLNAVPARGVPLEANQIPPIPDVVARVNGSEISSRQIKLAFQRTLKHARGPMTSQQKDLVLRGLIDKEVVRELIYQEGLKLNMKADPQTVETELNALRAAYKDEAEFQKALEERDITVDDLKKSIEVDSLAKVILEQHVKGQVNVDDAAVRKFYDDNRKKFHRPKAYRASHILISPFPPDMVRQSDIEELRAKKEELTAKARKKIGEIRDELKNGADFGELVKKYSHDESTVENGGDLGFFYQDSMEAPFGEAVAKLKIGETSDVVETTFGFHLIRLTAIKPSEYALFEEMEVPIRKHLFMERAQDRVQKYLEELRKKAKIEILY